MRAALAGAAWLTAAAPAFAYVGAPSPAEVAQAAQAGAALARPYRGYPVQDYLLYAVNDAQALDPADGCVDAVQVATPLERTRHAAFLAAVEARPLSPEAARKAASLPDGALDIVVFAHGRSGEDQGFLNRFAGAALSFGTGPANAPIAVARSPAFRDSYPHAPEPEKERYVGTIAFRFAVGPTAKAGELSFTDACGKAFRLPIDLDRFP